MKNDFLKEYLFQTISQKSEGQLDEVKSLIPDYFNANVMHETGKTPLLVAINGDQGEVMRYLIAQGADVNRSGRDGERPIERALDRCSEENLLMLLEAGATCDGLEAELSERFASVAIYGDLALAKKMLEVGANINFKNRERGNTALHHAVAEQKIDRIDFLLLSKANVNVQNQREQTPLMLAAKEESAAVMTRLLKCGADLGLKDEYGWTALAWAVHMKRPALAELLIRHGADVNFTDRHGKTLISIAKGNYLDDFVPFLEQMQLESHIRSDMGDTVAMEF